MNVKANLEAVAQKMYSKAVKELDDSQLYFAILNMTKDMMKDKGVIKGSKKIYYISAEFLIGKLLSNNLINLGIYEELDAALKEEGKELSRIEEVEPEPSLKRWTWQTCSLLSGFYRKPWASGRRHRLELSLWIV